MTKLSDASKEMIFSLYSNKNITPRALAEEYGVAVPTIYGILKGFGATFGGKRKTVIDYMEQAEVDALLKAYGAFEPIHRIAKRHNMSVNTMYSILRLMDIPHRTTSKEYLQSRQDRLDDAMEMYEFGWAIWFIKDRTGLNQGPIHEEIRKRGIPLRGHGNKGFVPMRKPDGGYEQDDEGNFVAIDPREETVLQYRRKLEEQQKEKEDDHARGDEQASDRDGGRR